MKQILTLLILSIILLTTGTASAQRNCSFPIDTARILGNQNLDIFLAALKSDSFSITNNKKDIPRFIKKQLNCYAHGFRIANPDQPYNATDVIIQNLPGRKLTFLAKSDNILVMRYNIGGIGVSSHLVLIKYNKRKIVDLWKGTCWTDLKNIQEVVNYLELKRSGKLGRNDGYVYF